MARLEGFGQPCMLKRHKAAESGSFKARIRSTWRNALRPGASGSGAGACGPEASATAARAGEREAQESNPRRTDPAGVQRDPASLECRASSRRASIPIDSIALDDLADAAKSNALLRKRCQCFSRMGRRTLTRAFCRIDSARIFKLSLQTGSTSYNDIAG